MDAEEEAWRTLSEELGEALLDAERTFLHVVDQRGANRLTRDEALQAYMLAWSRLAAANGLLTHFLVK